MKAQTFQFEHFSTSKGINFPFVYTIEQDLNGYLLIGTGEGLYKFDGFNFVPFYQKHGLSENFILSSCEDSNGNIWFGHNNGSVTSYDGKEFKAYDLSLFTNSRINAISTDSSGIIWAASQNDGLVKFAPGKSPKSFYKDLQGKLVYDMICIGSSLLLATDEGLILATENEKSGDNFDMEYVDGSPFGVTSISLGKNGDIIVGTEDEGVFMASSASPTMKFKEINPTLNLRQFKISDVRIDKKQNIWISTLGHSLIELPFENKAYRRVVNFGVDDQLTENVKTTFEDREGNLWIGTFGNGLSKLVDNHFAHFSFRDSNDERLEVHAYFSKGDSIWIGTNKGLLFALDRPNNIVPDYKTDGLPLDSIVSVLMDKKARLWVATAHRGLWRKDHTQDNFEPVELSTDRLSDLITSAVYADSLIFVGTKNGLFELNLNTDQVKRYSNQSGLLHNRIRALCYDDSGNLWIGSEGNGLNSLKDGKISTTQLLNGNRMFIVRGISQDQQGEVWVGTEGDGVLCLGKNDLVLNNDDGLYSNYCKGILTDDNNQLWVSHTGGVSRLNIEKRSLESFSQSKGLGHRYSDQCLFSDENGVVWLGSASGLTKYDKKRDLVNTTEPVINILSTHIGDSAYAYDTELRLASGSYKMKFDFIGVSHRNPDEVTYQYLLEGHDLDWSEVSSSREAQYNRVDPGEYTFKVKAFNADGKGGESVKSMKVFVAIPFYKKGWFYALLALALFGIIRYVIFQREKYLRQNQEFLQARLDERTREVVEQKELLESKNKDITSSIEYARSIQHAMLPPLDKLDQVFNEAFVYFKPRDIVSGDFYWIDEFGSKIILACADCTGHGVPGAFMSLIGSALLKEVCNMQSIHAPNAVLKMMDLELNDMINHHESEFGIADGMDIAVVEYDRDTKILRCSSARRSVVVYRNGKRIELKGDRFSIGGRESQEKNFTMHSLELNEGDVFYMFSDGLSDQFGGPKGKKFKKKRVIEMLDNFHADSMNAQRNHLAAHIRQWQGAYEQIDDIIFLGVRV